MAVARLQLEFWIAVAVVVVDQVVKAVVRSTFELHESLEVIPSFFNLTRVHNYGAAFGLMNAVEFPFKTVTLSAVAAFALGALAWYGATLPAGQRLARLALGG